MEKHKGDNTFDIIVEHQDIIFDNIAGQKMVATVMEIIKNNPLDDFWKEKNNEFLFEEINQMCELSGYRLILQKRKVK